VNSRVAKAVPSGERASSSDVPLLGHIPPTTSRSRKTKRLGSIEQRRRSPHPALHHFCPLAQVDLFPRSRVAGRLAEAIA
jgi:hypothetical protein